MINCFTLAFSYRNNEHHNFLINNLVDQAIPGASQFQLVAVGKLSKSIGFDARVFKYLDQFLFELLSQCIA
ncbi:hypothetical protein N005_19820 [Pseudomonas mediterranea CFBP 5447]|nr:hypothetical protein N005_19820 [Pseudomonas mediterranea CFBP 5447]